jgi:hypothetical protein
VIGRALARDDSTAAATAAVAVTDAGHDRRQAPGRVVAELAAQDAQLQACGALAAVDHAQEARNRGRHAQHELRAGRARGLREGGPALGAAEDHGVAAALRLEVLAADREQVAHAHAHRRNASDAGLGRTRRRGGGRHREHGGHREQAGDENATHA